MALIFQTLLYKVHSYSQASSNPDRTCHLCTADFFKKCYHIALCTAVLKMQKKVYFITWWNWTDVIVLSLIHVLNSTTNQLNVASQCGILFVTLMLIIMVNKDEWILDNVWFIKFRSKHISNTVLTVITTKFNELDVTYSYHLPNCPVNLHPLF